MPKKTIIEVLQNETGRLSATQLATTALLTSDLTFCIAVLFQDSEGNCSLTHADQMADLSYLQREAAQMVGTFSVYIIVRAEHVAEGEIADLTAVYLTEHIPNNLLDKVLVCQTNTGIVFFDGRIDTNISTDDLREMYDYPVRKRSTSNPLAEFEVIDRGRNSDLVKQHNYERMFETLFDDQQRMPHVIYDKMSGWQAAPQLSSKAAIALRRALATKEDELITVFHELLKAAWTTEAFTIPTNQQIIAYLPEFFREYIALDRANMMPADKKSLSVMSLFGSRGSIGNLINEYADEFNASILLEHLI